MSRLRITQSNGANDSYRVDLEFEADRKPRQTVTATFDLNVSEQDQEDLRWYLEEFLQSPQDPTPTIADRIERRISEIGKDLFSKVFHSDDARDLWAKLRDNLADTDVEVVTSVEGATAIPWELICDPRKDIPLALRAAAFVRAHPQAAQQPHVPSTSSGPIRILLVICRPRAGDDVPFRSVASRLIKGLSEQTQANYQLDVLRPPTFDQLGRVLRRAKADGKPYHVVHFDGHGIYAELTGAGNATQIRQKLSPVIYSAPRTGKHGFLVFEDLQNLENIALIDGPALGSLLVETGVTVLVLNACRSAHADVEGEPVKPGEPANPNARLQTTEASDNPHERVRTFGTLAQEVMDAGVAGVVAMRYNVYVVTAAQFVADLYAELVRGQTLGVAVTLGRKQLAAKPDRTIAYDLLPLQDWCVPVVYESIPIRLFPVQKKDDGLTIRIQAGDSASSRSTLDNNLPRPPDVGFFRRDETLFSLDRAFDTQPIVLLHAYAGSGKTATTAEFARWYSQTGGIAGPVFFTSFEQYKPLSRVLDQFGEVFGPALESSGTHWLALDEATRRRVSLDVLRQVPVLWIWDNIEPIAGFPKGTKSIWSDAEQRELVDFLRDARSTQAKFLLTSRRDEHHWLGDLPRRVQVPAMPMQERVQMARALAEKRGRRVTDVDDWRPLLRFTDGNPMTITVLVGQALRDGLKTKAQIAEFVLNLQAGTAKFDDEASEGRTKSLGASLSYGFEHAFNKDERKQLALLHFFQGFVNVDVLRAMGQPEAEGGLPELRGLTREAGIALLERAAEVGVLTSLGGGCYTIHPAVPWFFKSLFDAHYASLQTSTPVGGPGVGTQAESPIWAFVSAVGVLGRIFHSEYQKGNRGLIAALSAEETNLLHARRLARQIGGLVCVINCMQGLRALYEHKGRQAEWKALVDEIAPDFVDMATDGPRPGLEGEWIFVTEYRVQLAWGLRDWAKAERLQRFLVDCNRRCAEDIVDRYAGLIDAPSVGEEVEAPRSGQKPTPLEFRDRLVAVLPKLSIEERHTVRMWAISLEGLANIQRERQEPGCIATYEQVLDLSEQIGDRRMSATCAYNLGTAYKDIPAIRDLDKAEQWSRRSLDLHDEQDGLGGGKCHNLLGNVALDRFIEAWVRGVQVVTRLAYLNDAGKSFHAALRLIPVDAVDDLAVTHHGLGAFYANTDDIDRALPHYRETIRLAELQGGTYNAAHTRCGIANVLARSGRLADAREYALAALKGFDSYGPMAANDIQKTQALIRQIEADIATKKV